jgi:cellulose synthase (UDP-forming)
LVLQGHATCTGTKDGYPTVRVLFEPVNLTQQRRLIEMLFCRPG